MSTAIKNKQDFISYVEAHIGDQFDEPVKVKVMPIDKGYTSYTGCTVEFDLDDHSRPKIMPTANLDDIYDKFAGHQDIDRAIAEVKDIVTMPAPKGISSDSLKENLLSWDWVKDNIFVRLINVENVRPNSVYRTVADNLALIPYILINKDKNGFSSAAIMEDMLDMYGRSEDEIIDAAIENSENVLPSVSMSLMEALDMEDDGMPLRLVSNDTKTNGASAIFYPGKAKEVADRYYDGEDYYIIPSSVNEVLTLPKDGSFNAIDIANMIKNVNSEEGCVGPGEWLSDDVYSYDYENDEIRKEVI